MACDRRRPSQSCADGSFESPPRCLRAPSGGRRLEGRRDRGPSLWLSRGALARRPAAELAVHDGSSPTDVWRPSVRFVLRYLDIDQNSDSVDYNQKRHRHSAFAASAASLQQKFFYWL